MKNAYILLAMFAITFATGLFVGQNIGQKKPPETLKFEWEGLQRDIPEDGSYIQISGTESGVIYLNAIDE